MGNYEVNARNKVKRVPQRGAYDKETAYKILDAGFFCHMGFNVEGQPFVIPTLYARDGNKIYVHGATTSRMLGELKNGVPVCLTVTHVDGLVLARSAFHHAAIDECISIMPGDVFAAGRRYRNFIRLSFGHPWSEEIDRGIGTLGRLVHQMA